MSGHSHWAGIKHQKGIADQKRGRVFAKLLAAVAAAARGEPNPEFNPRLRAAIEKAREHMVPAENIARAIARASEPGQSVEELTLEAYGPGGAAILIQAATNNKNRTIAEVKKIVSDNHGKWAEPGSVRWAFAPAQPGGERRAKFPQPLGAKDLVRLRALVGALLSHDDVQKVFTSAARP
ncbi:MAG: hypothetical protein A3A43_01240 [Candidatus Liptonbacteria bacterium RIFCSPLOWO2_01_FULL_56_20]|uniref:Transcriptional regulator n=1 Tax=Candidatus Liptonbacteria bacterium RIFCSPLOWO2_01_FULL_56_20 TaxID=1798652 RepID=A0A1G2CLU7_9BACT|nr:MAG: transcriptional regulator [Parcubacteria group bacterium GW2011_GWB1_56_8]OGZ01398.1 MAG: hypothetical protein A3A43_01240 [Candidatus Liptonbacteria bacterium RIFCSPLOWO2_01_FULL_56_20]